MVRSSDCTRGSGGAPLVVTRVNVFLPASPVSDLPTSTSAVKSRLDLQRSDSRTEVSVRVLVTKTLSQETRGVWNFYVKEER